MEDYFLDNYYIIKRAKELGGILTQTGRGSAVSFLINKLLGFTTIPIDAAPPIIRAPLTPKLVLNNDFLLSPASSPHKSTWLTESFLHEAIQITLLWEEFLLFLITL